MRQTKKQKKQPILIYNTVLRTFCTVLYYVVGINVENILSASAVPLCNVHHLTATSQENKQSEENCADISAKTLLALGAVHKSLFGCESSPISCNVRTLVSQLVSKCNKAPSKAQ